MAAPNIVGPQTITAKTAALSSVTGATGTVLLNNSASSGKVLQVQCLYAANVDGASACDVTVKLHDQDDGAGAGHAICSTLSIPADATVIISDKSAGLWLEEDTSLVVTPSASDDLEFVCSYLEIAGSAQSGPALSQIDDGGYTWTGSGTFGSPYVTSYLRSGTPSIRGGSPGNWTSSNRPAWQVTGSGTFNYTLSNMFSGDADADHALYKSTDSGSTWALVHTFSFGSGAQSASFLVDDGDIVEQRGNGSFYSSDTWVDNPTVWIA